MKSPLSQSKSDIWTRSIYQMIDHLDKFNHVEINEFVNEKNKKLWTGGAVDWFNIEIMVFACYEFTLMVLVLKSRFIKVGIDSNH